MKKNSKNKKKRTAAPKTSQVNEKSTLQRAEAEEKDSATSRGASLQDDAPASPALDDDIPYVLPDVSDAAATEAADTAETADARETADAAESVNAAGTVDAEDVTESTNAARTADAADVTEPANAARTADAADVTEPANAARTAGAADVAESADAAAATDAGGKKKSKLWPALAVAAAAVIVVAGGLAAYQHIRYGNRWYQNTYINDVDVSGQTLAQSKETILNKLKGYGLTVRGRDHGTLTINGADIDYQMKINKAFDKLFEQAHRKSPLFSRKQEFSVNYDVQYDEEKLEELIDHAEIVKGSSDYRIIKPKSASVKYSQEKQQYECVRETAGNTVIKSALTRGIKSALSKAETELDINDTADNPSEDVVKNIYKAPKTTSDSPELQKQLNACNQAALRFISWNMGKGVTEQITPQEISSWIRYKNGRIKYDWDAVSDWVEAFCLKYKTVGINRKVKMHNGKTVTVKGGDYGWQLDFEKTLKQAKKALQAEIDQSLTQAYVENPSQENRMALTSKRKVQYANTAFKKDYEDFMRDWDPKNFIEVSLSQQKVYVIRNGKVKFSCHTISGRPTPERATKKGAYFIKEHNLSRVLVGDNYRTPVKNWVRITWTGTGFHSATWQPWSRWTKDLYKVRGSHGCLNLSLADSQKIYRLTKYREAVFIY